MKNITIKTRTGPEEYVYFTKEEADEIGICYLENWREASGPWQRVLTDDGHVVPVVNVGGHGRNGQRTFVRIPTGTFEALKSKKMTTEKRRNRFSFTGEYGQVRITNRVRLFAMQVGGNFVEPEEAHKLIWPNMTTVSRRSHMGRLLRDERVRNIMREELKDALKAENVDDRFVIQKLKSLLDRDEVPDKTVLEVVDRLEGLIDKAHEKDAPANPQLPGGIFAGMTLETIRSIAGGGSDRVSLTQGVSSRELIGQDVNLDSDGYEKMQVKEEGIEDRDAEDDAL